MKPDTQSDEEMETAAALTGDVIGHTVYSERFVLKILLKLANLDTLKDEIKEKSFEDDICSLWDMTTEKDVVLFLLKHDVLNLFNFALPSIESPRFIEIIIGIIGNMCCHRETLASLFKMNDFIAFIMDYIKSDDTMILIQVLRLFSSCLFLVNDEEMGIFMELVKTTEYSKSLYFILQNSVNKDLLMTALENFNTICSYCNVGKHRNEFFKHFITLEALESVTTGFSEIMNQKDSCERDDIERAIVITVQIILNLIGFETSIEMYNDSKENIVNTIEIVFNYYDDKLVNEKEIDTSFCDILDSSNTIVNALTINENCSPDKYFIQAHNIWKAVNVEKFDADTSNFEEDIPGLIEFSKQINPHISILLCGYMKDCKENDLYKVFDIIRNEYEDILSTVSDKELQREVSNRTLDYRTRLKDSVQFK